ncbi:FAD-dependent monooxygenase [Streptomyces sp. NPDC088725]|uniref:FAD-dependent monooxygenase n=1 Tax=Streptomyces sp. NPDC088725 TaxID=3365873 RepID=UPI0038171B07
MAPNRPKVLVIGAGIGGLALAAALRRAGIGAEIYERADRLRAAGTGLSVMSNAITALASAGIDLGLDRLGQAITSFVIKDAQGHDLARLPVPEAVRELGLPPSVAIGRTALHQSLLEAMGDVPVTLGATAVGFETRPDGVTVHFADGTRAEGDVLVGADGFHSVIRRELAGPEEVREGGYVCWLATVPFSRPGLRPGYVGHYRGNGRRFGLLDIGHGRFYWWGAKNMPAEEANGWSGTKDDIAATYSGWAEEVQAVIRATPEQDIVAVPAHDRAFLERWGEGRVTLLGDAAHPMLASVGQGAGMAIEDAVVLAGTLARSTDLTAGLRSYEDQRRARTRMAVAAARARSDGEQAEGPEQRREMAEELRRTPLADFARSQKDILTFPGVALPGLTVPGIRTRRNPRTDALCGSAGTGGPKAGE